MYYTKGNKNECFENGCDWEKEDKKSNAEFAGRGIDECPKPEVPEGKTKTYTNHYNVKGDKCEIINKNYYNNYYNRFNEYDVKECNYVKNYVKDCNIIHYDSETIFCGCEYLGCKNIVEDKKCGKKSDNCC